MNIVVVGGCGFIGSHLSEELIRRGHNVEIIGFNCQEENLVSMKGRYKFIRVDITDRAGVREAINANVDGVIHLAALINVDQSIQYPRLFFATNVAGTFNVLEAVSEKRIPKLLYMSTCEVYGNIPEGKATESHPTNPRSPYAASKFAAERYLLSYAYTYREPKITIVRGFNQYGTRQNPGSKGAVIPIFITRLLRGENILIHGDGSQTRDYVYVNDTVKGLANAFEKDLPSGEIINLATGTDTSIKEVATMICKLLGKNPEEHMEFIEDRPGQIMRSCGDYSKAKELLGWAPETPLDRGLKTCIEWYKDRARGE